MTDDIEYIDVDAPEYAKAPKPLRDHIARTQQAIRAVAQERDYYWEQAASAALRGVLASYINPERVKRELLSDGIDPLNREAVEKWLGENGDDYAMEDTP